MVHKHLGINAKYQRRKKSSAHQLSTHSHPLEMSKVAAHLSVHLYFESVFPSLIILRQFYPFTFYLYHPSPPHFIPLLLFYYTHYTKDIFETLTYSNPSLFLSHTELFFFFFCKNSMSWTQLSFFFLFTFCNKFYGYIKNIYKVILALKHFEGISIGYLFETIFIHTSRDLKTNSKYKFVKNAFFKNIWWLLIFITVLKIYELI